MEENKDLNIEAEEEKEAVDKADFAEVNYGEDNKEETEEAAEKTGEEETEETKEEKPKKKKFIGLAIAIGLVLILLIASIAKFAGGQNAGLSNRFGVVIGIPKGGYLIHTDYNGDKLYKSGIAKNNIGESEVISDDIAPWGFTEHGGSIYFFDRMKNGIYKLEKNGAATLIYDGVTYYHQYCGKYVYFMEPEASYGGFVKRVPLKGGEAETVLNVYTTSFAVSGKNIIYYDSSLNDLLVTTLDNALEFAKASEGEAMTSADIKAIVVAADRYAQNINVVGDNVYFTDASKENVICRASIKTGEVEEVNFGTAGTSLNVYGKYMFYVGSDNCLYRMNLDGKDIRNLTGNAFKTFAGFGLFKNRIVAYALMGQLNAETMQTDYMPVIVVMDFEGKPINVIPAVDMSMNNMYPGGEMPEVPEEVPEETEEESEATEETEG
ncbi:MAG: DUF5050 domain-containing protein [Clostridia bacterium]|nr:DUF5050 domain-containing protein [Clostridia bacterium]